MKKNNLTLALMIAMLSSLSLSTNIPKEEIKINAQEDIEKTTYSPVNGYAYGLDDFLAESPDSFEAWIKLPYNSLGGTIMGNRINSDGPNARHNSINWEVDVFGHLSFAWSDKTIMHSFDNTPSLFDDTWHHIALVRNNAKFIYYLDGNIVDEYQVNSKPAVSVMHMGIGADKKCWIEDKTPFEGYIRQITIYSGAISQEQIAIDMNKENLTASDTLSGETKIIGNWNFGDEWTERFVESTVEGTPKAEIQTFSKYVGADYSFGEYDYTFAIIPDVQIMARYNLNRLKNMTKWLVDNKERLNLKFAIEVGDLSDYGPGESYYANAAEGLSNLDNKVPYCVVPGNHDYDDNFASRNTTYLNKYFSTSKHSQLPGFGGVYEENKIENSYYLFEAGNINYLVINLEFHARPKVLRWANRIIERYPEHRVIINTHDCLQPNGTYLDEISNPGFDITTPKEMFDRLISKHNNVFLSVGGHHCYDDIVRREDIGENGNKITSMLVDGQGTKYKGESAQDMVLLMHVNETYKTINCVYYSPEKGMVWNIQNQFELSIADENNPTIGK